MGCPAKKWGCLWDAYGMLLTGCLWDTYRIAYRLPMGCLWDAYGMAYGAATVPQRCRDGAATVPQRGKRTKGQMVRLPFLSLKKASG